MLGRKKVLTVDKHEAALRARDEALAANAGTVAANAAPPTANPLNGILDRDPNVVTAKAKLAALQESAADSARKISDLEGKATAVPSTDSLADADAANVAAVVALQMEAASAAAAELARLRIQSQWLAGAITQQRGEVDNAYRRAVTAEIREEAANQYEERLDRLWSSFQRMMADAEGERGLLSVPIGGNKTIGHLVRATDHNLLMNINAASCRGQFERFKQQMAKRHNPNLKGR